MNLILNPSNPTESPSSLLADQKISRRHFVVGSSSTLALAAIPAHSQVSTGQQNPVELRGNQFSLEIGYQPVNFTGKPALATTVNGSLPGPTLRWKEGERVTIKVRNNLKEDSSIHWHGMILPSSMDGSPGFDSEPIKPGETFEYQFAIQQSGTYWYHSHSGFQEQTGVLGAIIIDPKDPDPVHFDREMVVQLSDWSDQAPQKIYGTLKKQSHYYNYSARTLGDWWRDVKNKGFVGTWKERQMWNQMRMSQSDISDVNGYAYTFLMNGVTPEVGWTGLFKAGEKVRLRIINGAAMTIFDVRIPGLSLTVVAADGQNIQPVTVDEFRIGVAETYDVIITPKADQAYTLFAQTIDRTGFARGTLTSDPARKATVPAMDHTPLLEHRDMGMDHSAHSGAAGGAHAGHSSSHAGMDHSAMNHSATNHVGMDHSNMNHTGTSKTDMDHSGMDHSGMNHSGTDKTDMDHAGMDKTDMDHSGMDHSGMNHAGMVHSKHTNQTPAVDAHAGHNMSEMEGMDHSAHSAAEKTAQKENSPKSAHDHSGADSAPVQAKRKLAKAGFGSNFDSSGPVKHLPSEQAAGVDMLSQAPASGLADPGIGLRDHAQRYGRKVLTYADLRSLHPTRDKREPSREIELHLTGNMHRYMWSINGISFASAQPLKLTYNERVRIILVNDTMMTHPIHLHGMWSELETGDPDYIPRKHTVIVQPGAKISYLVTADAKGRWAYHCHLLYHMLGMMRAVEVVEERTP